MTSTSDFSRNPSLARLLGLSFTAELEKFQEGSASWLWQKKLQKEFERTEPLMAAPSDNVFNRRVFLARNILKKRFNAQERIDAYMLLHCASALLNDAADNVRAKDPNLKRAARWEGLRQTYNGFLKSLDPAWSGDFEGGCQLANEIKKKVRW